MKRDICCLRHIKRLSDLAEFPFPAQVPHRAARAPSACFQDLFSLLPPSPLSFLPKTEERDEREERERRGARETAFRAATFCLTVRHKGNLSLWSTSLKTDDIERAAASSASCWLRSLLLLMLPLVLVKLYKMHEWPEAGGKRIEGVEKKRI